MRNYHFATMILLFTLPVWADYYVFDFGTQKSPVLEGSVQVTEEGGKNVRWAGSGKRTSRTSSIVQGMTVNSRTGRKTPPESYRSELTCDHVISDQADTLFLELPAGQYKLVLLSGRAGGSTGGPLGRSKVWDITATTKNGSSESATYAGQSDLRALYLDATADEKGIEIKLATRSHWLISGIIAVPVSEWQSALEQGVQAILDREFIMPPEEMAKWKLRSMPNTTPEPNWSDKQKQDGIVQYARPWCEPVWPDHYPRSHEINAPVRAFATWNEYEPMTFSLYALKDFKNVEVTLGDLKLEGSKPATIPSSAIVQRYVKYMLVRPNYTTLYTYYRAPDVLMPWKAQPLPGGENLRIWLTLKVPLAQPEGVYNGVATVKADGVTLEVPLSFRVLPIALQKDESLLYGQYYHHPLHNIDAAGDEFSRAWWQNKAESEHVDMREHGMNTLIMRLTGNYRNNQWEFWFDALQRDIDMARSVGLNRPLVCSIPCSALYRKHMPDSQMGPHLATVEMPPEAFFVELEDMIRTFEAEAKRRQWPKLYYYPVDEPNTSETSVKFMAAVMQAIKRVPGASTYVTADPAHEQFAPMRPYVDIWCCQPFSLGRTAILKDMTEREVEYWCYPNHIAGENDHTPTLGARMTYGFGFWESGYRALVPWIYQASRGDSWNYLDATSMDFFNRTDDDGSPIPVTLWEAYREGIDDHRYVFTLQSCIDRARQYGYEQEVAVAEKVLDDILAAFKVQTKYKNDGLWDPHAFDGWRWAVAEQILKLHALPDKLLKK